MDSTTLLAGGRIVNKHGGTAELVRELRHRLGLTQEKMAARLGVTFPTINRWENGRARPSPLALKQIEDLLTDLGENGQDLRAKYFPKERI
ncbi:MAG: helix-turn-helix domain-containing protein [Bryobacteraceae bacterium]